MKLERRKLAGSVGRKDCALQSLENEVEKLNNMITTLTQDLARRRRLSGEDQVEMIKCLEDEKAKLEIELRKAQDKVSDVTLDIKTLNNTNEQLQDEYASARAKLTLSEVVLRQKDGVHPSEGFLDKAQALWRELGVDLTHREAVRQQIDNCLEDTCKRKLEEASALKDDTSSGISKYETEVESMKRALGLVDTDPSADTANLALLKRLEWLKKEHAKIQGKI